MGAWFLRIKGGGYLTFGANGEKKNFHERTHQTINYLSCLFPQLFIFGQNVVELVIAWNGKSMGKNSNWAEIHFWKTCSDFLSKENAQKCMPFFHASTFSIFPHHSPSRWRFWEQLEFFLCLSFHVFSCWLHFFPWMGGRFCSAGDWVVFLTFLELLVHFPFTFLEVSCVFTMAVKSHSRFGLSHWLLVSRTGYLGCFFPAVSCAHW